MWKTRTGNRYTLYQIFIHRATHFSFSKRKTGFVSAPTGGDKQKAPSDEGADTAKP